MANINLLPWREQRREENKQQFFIFLGLSSGIVFLFLLILHLFFDGRIRYQNSKNEYLQQQITLLDGQISEINQYKDKKDKILTRMNLIYSLRDKRPIIINIFSNIVDFMPSGIYLTQLKREGGQFTLIGKAESNMVISDLMRKLQNSSFFENPALDKIETDEKKLPKRSEFELTVKQMGVNEPSEVKLDATPP